MEVLLSAQMLQWSGCVAGLAGAVLLASRTQFSDYGLVGVLASSVLWLAFGMVTKAPGLAVMSLAFGVMSLLNIWTRIVQPWRARRELFARPKGMRRIRRRLLTSSAP